MTEQQFQIQGVVDQVYDARAMVVNDTRIGAPFRKTLADVTTGGVITPGCQVLVMYTQRPDKHGKVWNNAASIQVLSAGAAPQAAAAAAYAQSSPTAAPNTQAVVTSIPTGGRPNPQYRSPDEMIREVALVNSLEFYKLVGLDPAATSVQALVKVAKLAGLFEGFINGKVTAVDIADKFGAVHHAAVSQDVAVPAEQDKPVVVMPGGEPSSAPVQAAAPAPSPEAVAAAVAATSGGDEQAAAASALDAFVSGV